MKTNKYQLCKINKVKYHNQKEYISLFPINTRGEKIEKKNFLISSDSLKKKIGFNIDASFTRFIFSSMYNTKIYIDTESMEELSGDVFYVKNEFLEKKDEEESFLVKDFFFTDPSKKKASFESNKNMDYIDSKIVYVDKLNIYVNILGTEEIKRLEALDFFINRITPLNMFFVNNERIRLYKAVNELGDVEYRPLGLRDIKLDLLKHLRKGSIYEARIIGVLGIDNVAVEINRGVVGFCRIETPGIGVTLDSIVLVKIVRVDMEDLNFVGEVVFV